MTVVVLPTAETMEPIELDKMNWARKTMDETRATSVPNPRGWMEACLSPLASSANYAMKNT